MSPDHVDPTPESTLTDSLKEALARDQIGNLGWNAHDFDAASHGLPELDTMALTELVVELLDDLQTHTRLRHDFRKGFSEHGIQYAIKCLATRLPHKLPDKSIDAALEGKAEEVYADLREMAQRVYDIHDERAEAMALADRIHAYADGIKAGLAAKEEGHRVLRDTLDLLAKDTDPRLQEFAQTSLKMFAHDNKHHHRDLEFVVRQRKLKIDKISPIKEQEEGGEEHNDRLDQAFRESIGDRAKDLLGRVSYLGGRLGRAGPLASAGLFAAAGITGAFLGYEILGDRVEAHFLNNDLNARTEYSLDAGVQAGGLIDTDGGPEEAAQAAQLAGDLAIWSMDVAYMTVNGSDASRFPTLEETMRQIKQSITILEAELVEGQPFYEDPVLAEVVTKIVRGGDQIRASIDEGYMQFGHMEESCSFNSDGTQSCFSYWVCDYSITDWDVDHQRGRQGLEEIKEGFSDLVLENGQTLEEMDFDWFQRGAYGNMVNETFESYLRGVAGDSNLPGKIAEMDEVWESVPQHHSEWNPGCWHGSWWADDMVSSVDRQTNNVGGFLTVRDNLRAALGVVDQVYETLDSGMSVEEIAGTEMGDLAIDMLRAIGYPKGDGHLYQDEIDSTVTMWRWIIAGAIMASAAGGWYIKERGEFEHRNRSYY